MQQLTTDIAVAPVTHTTRVTQKKKKSLRRDILLVAVLLGLLLSSGLAITHPASTHQPSSHRLRVAQARPPDLVVTGPMLIKPNVGQIVSDAIAAHAYIAGLIDLQFKQYVATLAAHKTASQVHHVVSHGCTTLEDCRTCVTNAESGSAGLYRAYNPSGAAGRYQAEPGTWQDYHGYASAIDAPPAVQDQWFDEAYARYHGTPTWSGSLYTDGC